MAVEMMTSETFREFGLTPPGEVAREEIDRWWKRLAPMISCSLGPGLGWTEEDRRYIGKLYYHFVEGASDWVMPHLKLAQFLTALKVDNEAYFTKDIWTVIGPAAAREYNLSMGLWYENGYPKIVLDPKYASALMSTKLSQDVSDMIIPPWGAFMIELTDSPLTLITKHKTEVSVDHLFVHTKQGGFTMLALAGSWDLLGLGTASKEDLVKDEMGRIEEYLQQHQHTLSDIEEAQMSLAGFNRGEATEFMRSNARLMGLAQRLVAGVCLAMSDPRNVRQRKVVKTHTIKDKARRGLPAVRVFDVGRPIKVDCRPTVIDFLKGRRGSVQNVQVLVRGHWKSQAHGPNHSLRKALHIEPYWRGPEDAPILTRPHIIEP